ncbi:DUF2946 family protein [Pseudoroseomonas globiformis]|uniref:DUF2946 family protein n=1 Tax=Teichococcus globiformis TaxID=2307229 RepID=A0ABV7FXC0_9PROT
MLRPARPMLRLLALLLLMQWGGWPLPHLGGMAAAGELTVICSPEGLHEVRIGPDGKPVEPPPMAMGCCLMCQGPLAGGDLLPPPVLPEPSVVAAPSVAMAEAVRQLLFSPPPNTHRSRAPPFS